MASMAAPESRGETRDNMVARHGKHNGQNNQPKMGTEILEQAAQDLRRTALGALKGSTGSTIHTASTSSPTCRWYSSRYMGQVRISSSWDPAHLLPLIQDKNLIAIPHGGNPLCHNHRRAEPLALLQGPAKICIGFIVQGRGTVVQQQNLRISCQGRGR